MDDLSAEMQNTLAEILMKNGRPLTIGNSERNMVNYALVEISKGDRTGKNLIKYTERIIEQKHPEYTEDLKKAKIEYHRVNFLRDLEEFPENTHPNAEHCLMERLKKLSDDSHHTEYATAIDEAKVEKNAIKLEKHFKRMESGNLSQETYEYIQTLLDKLKEQDSRLWQGFIHFYHDIKVTGHETAITEKIEQIRNAHTDCKDTLKTVMESGFTKAEEDARRCMAFFMKDDPEKFDIYESQLADALEESKKT